MDQDELEKETAQNEEQGGGIPEADAFSAEQEETANAYESASALTNIGGGSSAGTPASES
jgi:hypothetical protein